MTTIFIGITVLLSLLLPAMNQNYSLVDSLILVVLSCLILGIGLVIFS